VQFIFSTGSDNLADRSGLEAVGYDAAGHVIDSWVLKNAGAPEFSNDTQQNLIESLKHNGEVPAYILMHIEQHSGCFGCNDDTWNVDGVNVMTWQADGPEVCYYNNQPSTFANDDPVFSVTNNTIKFFLKPVQGWWWAVTREPSGRAAFATFEQVRTSPRRRRRQRPGRLARCVHVFVH
jgi:hypothetical protein